MINPSTLTMSIDTDIQINDDVVDAGLTAIFGKLLDPSATVVTGLTSDNISTSVRNYPATFPYLEAAR